ncbi:MAG: hypothetical protein R6W73_01040 [Candidatus Saliniplasma sp.]
MSELKFGICGDLDWHNTSREDNPLITLRRSKVKDMVEKLNRNPKNKEELVNENEDILEDIEKLLKLDVLKEKNDKIFVNFTLIDERDNKIIFDICEEYASDLAEDFIGKKKQIFSILGSYRNPRIEKEKLAFIVIGCYLLDWGSLELLSEWGVCDHRKQQAGGNEYVLWGESEVGASLKGVYWGGHSLFMDSYTFHTFGDHHEYTERKAFPDIIYRFPDLDFDGGDEYRSILFDKRKEMLEELGRFIDDIGKSGSEKRDIEKRWADKSRYITLLKKLNYLEEVDGMLYLNIPYFTDDDIDMILDCIEPFIKVLKKWIHENIDNIRSSLSETRPLRNGVPFEVYFIQIWHVIFGMTNKKLAESGLIYDTYRDDSDHEGYLPALVKGEVLEKVEKKRIEGPF